MAIYEEIMDCRFTDEPVIEAHEKLKEVMVGLCESEREAISYIYCVPRRHSSLGKPFFGMDIKHLSVRIHKTDLETRAILGRLHDQDLILFGSSQEIYEMGSLIDIAMSDSLSYMVRESSERELMREEFEEQATTGWRLEKTCFDYYDRDEDDEYYDDESEQEYFIDEEQED